MSDGARIPFGEREGALYRAHEVDNGLACSCRCPACRHPLIAANRGTKVTPISAMRPTATAWRVSSRGFC